MLFRPAVNIAARSLLGGIGCDTVTGVAPGVDLDVGAATAADGVSAAGGPDTLGACASVVAVTATRWGTEDEDPEAASSSASCLDAGGERVVILFFSFPLDLTGAKFFLFFPDLITGPLRTGDAPMSGSSWNPDLIGGSSSGWVATSSMIMEPGVRKTASVDSPESVSDMKEGVGSTGHRAMLCWEDSAMKRD